MSMDSHHHLANVAHYHHELQQQQQQSRGSMSRSSTTATGSGAGASPAQAQAAGPQEIDFTLPNVRPGLAKLGRRLTEMSENFLYDEPKTASASPSGAASSSSKRASRASMDTPVPFMGDEPVFCPFCNKPLPPALLLSHMSAAVEQEGPKAPNPRTAGVAESAGMVKTTSAPAPVTPTKARPQPPALQHKPSGISSSRPTSPQPKTTSAQLASSVSRADSVDSTAARALVEVDDLRRWSKIAGIDLDLPTSQVEAAAGTSTQATVAPTTAKPFPKIAPPPEDQARSSSRNSSRFNLFGKSKAKEDDDDDESDDDFAGAGGYAKLDAPASPEREEKDLPALGSKRAAEADTATEKEETAGSTPEVVQAEAEPEPEPAPASDAEVRAVLKEVLTRINDISKSHASVLHSHSTLLTTLKIARSNLAMAEANAEMLEEQLKQQAKTIAKAPAPAATSATRPASAVTNSPMGPPPVPRPAPTRTATTGPGAGEGIKALPATDVAAATRKSAETTRPMSIQIPSSSNSASVSNLRAQGYNPPSSAVSASSESKGMFGSFWNRNKDKVDTFMSSLPDFTPVAEKSSFDFARSPTTPGGVPYGVPVPDQYRSPGSAAAPGLNRSKTIHGRVGGDHEGLTRSSSYTNVLHAPAGPTPGSSPSASRPKPQAPSDPYTQELTRLRNLHTSAQAKIESMSKELADLKKGKLDMEAELENLSQALFEEANKMVSDEKKKRAELEESLKEVKEEREALRETIKVLGGQVEDQKSSRGDPDEEKDDLAELPDFQPRDLDKHYEALRKSIHHVADGAEWDHPSAAAAAASASAEEESVPTSTPLPPRRHSLPDIASPEPQRAPALHDPWADSGSGSGHNKSNNVFNLQPLSKAADDEDVGPTDTPSSTGNGLGLATGPDSPERPKSSASGPVSPKAEKLDALDDMMEKMQADIELDSPKKEKIGL